TVWLPHAESAPRKNEKQPELDYHQPVVNPGGNRHHKKNSTSAATSPEASTSELTTADVTTAAATACANPVACENQLIGDAPTTWRLLEPGDAAVQGF